MVGAGLSINADPMPGITSKFPTWRELARAIFDELHPSQAGESADDVAAKERKFANSNSLRIASEYEAAFGRRKLNQLLQAQTPDINHSPGELHRQLLELPWADIFTTNYDTLLERVETPEQSYQCVLTTEELTTAFAPRIIKLHGSFPSQTQLIITEEDYRSYPADFAPFVNTVQQALIETSFVMLGFSGDDPNFLAWTGWIRDKLGEHHAPIYLVGALSLSAAERALLHRRGVTPIDFSPVLGTGPYKNGNHEAAIWEFIKSMNAAKLPRPERWPDFPDTKRLPVEISKYAPETLFIPSAPKFPKNNSSIDDVIEVLTRWSYERKHYPGWLVATDERRAKIYRNTKSWSANIIKLTAEWANVDRLLVYREINWRYETAMVTLFEDTVQPFRDVIVALSKDVEGGNILRPSQEGTPFAEVPSAEIMGSWLELTFALQREAREVCNEVSWNFYKEKLDVVIPQFPQYLDRYHYESALWMMWKIKRIEARAILAKWQPTANNPQAAIWKAGLLLELDELQEGKALLRNSLRQIRASLNLQPRNIELLSTEGWCTYLLFAVEQMLNLRNSSTFWEEFTQRWDELKRWDCNPWPLQKYFDTALSDVMPEASGIRRKRTNHFDIWDKGTSLHIRNDNIEPFIPALACLRFFEQSGVPMRMSRLNIARDALRQACKWIEPFVGFGSSAVLIRSGNRDYIKKDKAFDRCGLAIMDADHALRLNSWCSEVLHRELDGLEGMPNYGSASEDLLGILSELLSRLTFRLPEKELNESFSLAVKLQIHPGIRKHLSLHEVCKPWFDRLFDKAEPETLLPWLPQLLELPTFADDVNDKIPEHRVWPDPLKNFPCRSMLDFCESMPVEVEKVRSAVEKLLAKAPSEHGEARKRTIHRIIVVHSAGLLTQKQASALKDLTWSRRTRDGLPDTPGIALVSFLRVPVPTDVDVRSLIKKHILGLPVMMMVKRKDGRFNSSFSIVPEPIIHEASSVSKPVCELFGEGGGSITWSGEEIRYLKKRSLDWWNNDKIVLDPKYRDISFGINGIESTAAALTKLLARVILPGMKRASEKDWEAILGMLAEMRGHAFYPSLALPYVLIHRSSQLKVVAKTLQDDLCAESNEIVAAAVEAIRHWCHLSHANQVPPIPRQMLEELVMRVVLRNQVGTIPMLESLTYLLVERPELFLKPMINSLARSLTQWHASLKLNTAESEVNEFENSAKPEIRWWVAHLAWAIDQYFKTTSPKMPEHSGVSLWRKICAEDPLPEMRRAFYELNFLRDRAHKADKALKTVRKRKKPK